MNRRVFWPILTGVWGLVVLGGCGSGQTNPSFAVSPGDARAELRRLRDEPIDPERPIVVLAGWGDPFFANTFWCDQLKQQGVPGDRVVGLSFFGRWSFDACRDRLIAAVDERWPAADPAWTTEVDVVAFSMGGLVARYAAAEPWSDGTTPRRLRVRRLFTISTPHRGARLARLPALDARVVDMRPGSDFLGRLDAALADADYALTPYTRLGDWVVGPENTAPPGRNPHWVPTPVLHRQHQEAYRDPRIRADILRRLRDESPLTTEPPAPLPD